MAVKESTGPAPDFAIHVSSPDGQLLFKTLDELQPYYWYRAYNQNQ